VDKIKIHLKKWWWAYILGLVLIVAFYQYGKNKGWWGSGNISDDVRPLSTELDLPYFPDLNYNKQISLNDSDAYSRALITFLHGGSGDMAGSTGTSANWQEHSNPSLTFNDSLNMYLTEHMPAYNAANPNTKIVYTNSINLNDAIRFAFWDAAN